ncbi:MAG: preprotein translocase subunit SecY [Candidatus Pacearchaeota archaeon]
MDLEKIFTNLPEIKSPIEKKLSFNTKLKWTLIVLFLFFVLANIPLYGLERNSLERFKYLAIILGTDFGSIISLGIGPIVTASIILQLLIGGGLIKIDLHSEEGKKYFQGLQKLFVYIFIIFEASLYVLMRGLQAMPGFKTIMILQLILGGIAIVFMDDLVQKWGFGSGVSLFIAAGVGWRIVTGLLQFIGADGGNCLTDFSRTPCAGKLLVIIQALINQAPREAIGAFLVLFFTALIFVVVVWAQSLRIEVPLSFDRIRGYGIKWPLAFFYASVIPVILTAALTANLQLFAGLLETGLGRPTFLGTFSQGVPIAGLAFWLHPVNLVQGIATGSLRTVDIFRAITSTLFFIVFSTIFAVLWVKTSGMDAASQAQNILSR